MPGETSREQKLAAARKKLRDYQNKKVQTQQKSVTPDQQSIAASSPSSSGQSTPHSNGNNQNETSTIPDLIKVGIPEAQNGSDLPQTDLTTVAQLDDVDLVLIQDEGDQIYSTSNNQQQSMGLSSPSDGEQEGSVSSSSMCTIVPALLDQVAQSSPKSTTESLRQLSLQISGLMTDSDNKEPIVSDLVVAELERRNEELAYMLSEEKQKALQMGQYIDEMGSQLAVRQQEIDLLKKSEVTSAQAKADHGTTTKDLQTHIETIGVLVADKSALQVALDIAKQELSLKNEEIADLKQRVESSYQSSKKLEGTLSQKDTQLASLNDSTQNTALQLGIFQQKYNVLSHQHEEMEATVDELKERLAAKSAENETLIKELESSRSKVELANIHIQQLRDSSNGDLATQLCQLQLSFAEAQTQITFLNSTLQQNQQEKINLEHQYKSYTNQLAAELEQSKQKMNEDSCVAQEMQVKVEKLQKKVADLECSSTQPSPEDQLNIQQLQTSMHQTRQHNQELLQKYAALERDNGELSKMLSEERETRERIETAVERQDSQEVDTHQLLQSMQSDKVAAARALTQNKQLKEQLEELQNGFIMMSNKKLELTEKLEVELHAKKALNKQMDQLKQQFAAQQESLLSKDTELSTSRQDKRVESTATIDQTENSELATVNGETATENEILEDETSVSHGQMSPHGALEERFTRCMRDLAAKCDENQRLEHIVTQLQLETEAVGDYITIYQFQRGVMKKDMQALTAEKEHLAHKLHKLQKLAQHLDSSNENQVLNQINDCTQVEAVLPEQPEDTVTPDTGVNGPAPSESVTDEPTNSKTVQKIMDLIKEMETTPPSNGSAVPKFHACQLCSGQLIHI